MKYQAINAKEKTASPARKKSHSAISTLKTLQKVRNAKCVEFSTVKNTDSAYNGHIARGMQFLREIVKERRENGERACSLGIPTDELERVFDKPPNQYSAMALEMFLVQKCFTDGLGSSTSDGIHGAFASYWDTMDNDCYSGAYSYDEKQYKVLGCPTRASAVRSVLQAVKTRAHTKGALATRNHAEAITIEEIQKLMNWSEKNCPNEKLTSTPVENMEEWGSVKYRLMHAFMTSAFMLWTRCFELLSLQAGDIENGCIGPAPYYIPHFKIHLENRKGWQKEKGYDGPRTSNIYDIYQQEVSEIDMSTHLPRWKNFLTTQIGGEFEENDFLFPYIAPNGVIHIKQHMSYAALQGLLTKFSDGADIMKHYTTHCFQRGGAQYRFMFAPIGMRWSLSRIRWWGGWAIGEHVDTLIKYLVGSLQSYESGHGGALHPIPLDPEKTFMGDHLSLKPVTTEEFFQLKHSISHMDEKLDAIASTISSAMEGSSDLVSCAVPERSSPSKHMSYQQSLHTDHVQIPLPSPINPHHVHSGLDSSTIANSGATSCVRAQSALPISGVSIPNLGHVPGAWRRAIMQWQEVDPVTNCILKDQPKHWSQQQIVFEEYERLGRSDTCFLEEYPNANKSINNLLNMIRAKTSRTRNRKKHAMDTA
ncbi:hypothetical protein BYT27DRAFT_7228935 [Phlegmacium glaucopus]|nr:hypothetical protein BYT27DRAFT_7228935 [Phlegmacium glaucopus]